MSIDLSRPQVNSMGLHDPLDGLITFLEIRERSPVRQKLQPHSLDAAISDLTDMCLGVNWTTHDPLGLGGLLADAWRLAQLYSDNTASGLSELLEDMLDAALVGLSIFIQEDSTNRTAASRLAFRELGLSIGLQAVGRLESLVAGSPNLFSNRSRLGSLLDALQQYLPLLEKIEQFWLDSNNREVPAWQDHAEINMVMLATSLAPEGYLDL